MRPFAESLADDVTKQLATIDLNNINTQQSEQAIFTLIEALEKLKSFFLKYKFSSTTEEIVFFRDIKPQFASQLIFYNEVYNIDSRKPCSGKKVLRKYYNAELSRLKSFFDENAEFYRYYRTGNRCLDNQYFVRGKHDIKLTLDSFYLQADKRFSTSHDFKVAMIIANERIRSHLEYEIEKLANDSPPVDHSGRKLKWTASKVSIIELIYALHTEGAFNNGSCELKEIATAFQSAFGIDLGQFNRTFLEIRDRKSARTKFLDTLTEKLVLRMDAADER